MTTLYRLSGAGNDFLAAADPPDDPAPELIRAWCARGISLGADGLFVLRPGHGGVAMRYFNADGGEAALCLNGTRCAARLAFHLGWAAGGQVTVETGSGPVRCRDAGGDRVAAEVAVPVEPPRAMTLEGGGRAWEAWYLVVGVPHLVIPWEGAMSEAPVAVAGPGLRAHSALGEAGANVSWVRLRAPSGIDIRTYERGVEAETLACGTGVLAAAAVGLLHGGLIAPVEALTRGGFRLTVDAVVAGGRPVSWSLTGDARVVARSEPLPGAEALPAPPDW